MLSGDVSPDTMRESAGVGKLSEAPVMIARRHFAIIMKENQVQILTSGMQTLQNVTLPLKAHYIR
jgi:hypothetical protein